MLEIEINIQKGLNFIAKAFEGHENNEETRELIRFNIASFLMMCNTTVANITIIEKENNKWEIKINEEN